MHPDNLETRKLFVLRCRFKVCTGASYLGSFIGDGEYKWYWLQDHTAEWEKNIHTTRKTTVQYTQESYAVVIRVIQLEWIFLQRVTKNTGCVFVVVKNIIQETFFPRLFFVK